MEAKQLKNINEVIGKTISDIYIDSDFNTLIFFTDNSWFILSDDGVVVEDDYFSEDFKVREYQWTRVFIDKSNNPKTPEDIQLTPLGQKLIDLGYITKDKIISDWVTFQCRRLESRILVKKVDLDNYKKMSPEIELKKLKEDYKRFQKIFGKYINTVWGDEESDF